MLTCPQKSAFGRSSVFDRQCSCTTSPPFGILQLTVGNVVHTKICVHMDMHGCGASLHAMHQALALFVCESDYAMQVPVVGINSTQDALCGSQDHCNSMMLSKKSYIDNQENAHPWRQHPQSDRSNLMPDGYWLGPNGLTDAKVECHIKPQTIDCLNHLRKQRTALPQNL